MFTLDSPSTSVLVVDMQNDNFHEDGAFASTGAAVHAAQPGVVPNVLRVLDAARAAGAAVFRIVVYFVAMSAVRTLPSLGCSAPSLLKVGSW